MGRIRFVVVMKNFCMLYCIEKGGFMFVWLIVLFLWWYGFFDV